MTFDFRAFFEGEGIQFATEGKNVARGQIHVNCFLCGDDHTFHLGCDPRTGRWGCWRNKAHRGSDPARLVALLKGIPLAKAREITGGEWAGAGDTLSSLRKRLANLDLVAVQTEEVLRLPSEFLPLTKTGITRHAWNYLEERGFDDIPTLTKEYKLLVALSGRFARRLILPLYSGGKLRGWTGRAWGDARLRYLSEPEGPSLKRYLFNADNVGVGGHTLLLTEGPLDCLKVDFYGAPEGVRAVAGLGITWTAAQEEAVLRLADRFARVAILLDVGAFGPARYLAGRLALLGPRVLSLPPGRKDPGEMTAGEVVRMARRWVVGKI